MIAPIGQVGIPVRDPRVEELVAEVRHGTGAGAEHAMEELLRDYARLVKGAAARYAGLGLSHEDLVAEGNVGLLRAAERFDPLRGAQFSTYAVYWIHHQIRRALDRESRTIRIPGGTVDRIRKLRATQTELREELGRDPSDGELALRLGWNADIVRRLRFSDVRAEAGLTPADHDESRSDGVDRQARHDETPERVMASKDSCRFVHELLGRLTERETAVVRMYFGMDAAPPQTHAAIGRRVGVSSERVRQIHKRSIEKLRTLFTLHFEDVQPLIA
jgi:RNA polymerase nonessential primary-like sigma factor